MDKKETWLVKHNWSLQCHVCGPFKVCLCSATVALFSLLFSLMSQLALIDHLPPPRPSYPWPSAVVIMPVGPFHPCMTPNLMGYDSILCFQQLSAAFVHVNELLDLCLQALNKEHYPNRNMTGFCYCRGRLFLVTDLSIEQGDDASNQCVLDTLEKQKLQVCRALLAWAVQVADRSSVQLVWNCDRHAPFWLYSAHLTRCPSHAPMLACSPPSTWAYV